MQNIRFGDWEFEVDHELTSKTYQTVSISGADGCICNDCKNYVAFRDRVFPNYVIDLFNDLGIDYRKEVEVTSWEKLANGLHHIGGWFHFKGRVLKGKDFRVLLPDGNGFTFDLTKIDENFSIGFAEMSELAFFDSKDGLVQVEFSTNIPWVIDKSLEMNE